MTYAELSRLLSFGDAPVVRLEGTNFPPKCAARERFWNF